MDHKNSSYTIFYLLISLGTGTGTHYEQDGSGFEPSWDTEFSLHHNCPVRQWRPHNVLYSAHCFTFPVVKRPGPGLDHLIPPNANVQHG